MIQHTNAQRRNLRLLYRMLWGIPEDRLRMAGWTTHSHPSENTQACLAGWAAMFPPFIKQGYSLRGTVMPHYYPEGEGSPGYTNWEAVVEFFGLRGVGNIILHSEDSQMLFLPGSYDASKLIKLQALARLRVYMYYQGIITNSTEALLSKAEKEGVMP